MNLMKKLRIGPHERIDLSNFDPAEDHGLTKEQSHKITNKNIERLFKLQNLLYSERKNSLLIILQGMDASGKDGVINHVMSGVNPQGCTVTSFKVPSQEELDHDYLWRIHNKLPSRGEIRIFNRSHYEDVLAVRVHDLVPKEVWKDRFDQINEFEKYLTENDVTIIKFFLHIGKDEQKKRLEERIQNPEKNWKFNTNDLKERELWKSYVKAYEDVLSRCSSKRAPWYVIPAEKKWFRNCAVSDVVVRTMEEMDLKFPKLRLDLSQIKIK